MKENRFVLTGGLGNQLFQFAAALSFSREHNLLPEFECSLGNPRGMDGIPDLLGFKIPRKEIRFSSSHLLTRALGFSLRFQNTQKTANPKILGRKLVESLLSLIASGCLLTWVKLKSPSGVGYDPYFKIGRNRNLIIGYFQSEEYFVKCPGALDSIKHLQIAATENEEILRYKILGQIDQPLVVHVRRGDYAQQNSFGLLAEKYYSDLIREVYSNGRYKKIWLFSDDMQDAISCIPRELQSEVRQIEEIEKSPAKTLEVMRFGHGYIIANSSFSWWGAYLSYSEKAEVHAPYPWFKGMDTPERIIPTEWMTHNSVFK